LNWAKEKLSDTTETFTWHFSQLLLCKTFHSTSHTYTSVSFY